MSSDAFSKCDSLELIYLENGCKVDLSCVDLHHRVKVVSQTILDGGVHIPSLR